MISASGGLPAHRYTAQVTQRWPRGSEPASPYQDLPRGLSKHLPGTLFPPWIIGRISMIALEAHIVGAEWAREWDLWCATTRAAGSPTLQNGAFPLEGWGRHAAAAHDYPQAGSDRPWDAPPTELLQAAPEPHAGWRGDVSSHLLARLPPRLVLHAANILRAAENHTWGCNTATVRWLPPEDGGTQRTVRHFKKGGPTYHLALSRLGNFSGPLLLMLPTDLAAALRQQLDGCNGLRVGWEAVAKGTLLNLHHRGTAEECRRDALVPHLTGRHTYMPAPQGQPHPAWGDVIAAFHDHKILSDDTWHAVRQQTLGRDYRRLFPARLLELRGPLRQRLDDLRLRRLDPWFRPPTSCTPATSVGNATQYPQPRPRAPTGARSALRWRRAPGLSHPRARA